MAKMMDIIGLGFISPLSVFHIFHIESTTTSTR
jgi:hypothetical protein